MDETYGVLDEELGIEDGDEDDDTPDMDKMDDKEDE